MRTALFAASLGTGLLAGYAQNPVPNPSFESWTGGVPDSWSILDVGSPSPTVIQVATPYTGDYAVKGQQVNSCGNSYYPLVESTVGMTGFPVTEPYAYFSFYYMVAPNVVGEFYAYLEMSDASSNTVCTVDWSVTNATTPTYTYVNIPLSYTGWPSECRIGFALVASSSNPPDTYFIVDEVELYGTVSGVPEPPRGIIGRIHPNPVHGSFTVTFDLPTASDVVIQVSDLYGRVRMHEPLGYRAAGKHLHAVELDLPVGTYLVNVSDGVRTGYQKLVVVND